MGLILTVVFALIIAGTFIWLVTSTSKSGAAFQKYLSTVAVQNNWRTSTPAPLIPMFERLGYQSQLTLLEGRVGEDTFWLYECQPPAQDLNSHEKQLTVTLLSVAYPQAFPDLIIVPVGGILAKAFDRAMQADFSLVPLKLEGNFNQYVQVYARAGEEVDVLTYLTPEVMALIQDRIKSFVVLSGNYLSVSAYMPFSQQTVEAILGDMSALLGEIRKKPFLSSQD